ncbi:hypothetical protein HOG16_04055, partial [Candidatus Woesearchaeota archaeon]|nr:hypothetical protein [Candidatus Woesearchaeota archaeon]
MRQGRVGKSLDSIEAEAKEKAKQVYDIEETEINGAAEKRIGRVNAKYDAMIDNASDEAREAWGLSNPL